jgi:hypothetical protein
MRALIVTVTNGCDNANSRPCWPLHPRLENRTEIPYVLHRQQAILIRKICKRTYLKFLYGIIIIIIYN